MSDPVRQWKRLARVEIGNATTTLLIEELRMQFEIVKTIDKNPNTCTVRLFNLTPNHEQKIKAEFDKIAVYAGYDQSVQTGASGKKYMPLIFRGNVKYVHRYRDKNDYITEIEAGDGDKDFRQAVMNETMAAGTTMAQIVDRAIDTFKTLGGTIKGLVQVPAHGHTRGKVLSGNTRDILDHVARDAKANWSIQDGQLDMVGINAVLPTETIVISAETGMLNAPEVNDKGIAVKSLLNPHLRVNGSIQLDNNRIRKLRQKKAALIQTAEPAEPVRLDPDGVYKILQVTHKGDTRGADWISEVECIGLDQPIPPSRSGGTGAQQ